MTQVFVGLGSNMGDPIAQLRQAATSLRSLPGVSDFVASSLYRSAPIGGPAQSDYYNAVARMNWSGQPIALLDSLLAIEHAAGRKRDPNQRNAPRNLDLDLLLFADLCLTDERLQLPHPRMCERAFVLLPLSELAPDLVVPGAGPIAAMLPGVAGQSLQRLELRLV